MSKKQENDAFKMMPEERRAASWLASIYALRMFGMFMILPVFAVAASTMPDGNNPELVGLAMGIYGLTQAIMQIPLGWASDKLGRKPVIIAGLLVFAAGCVLGFTATTVEQLVVARALQGAGAVSAALSAFLADATRDEVRSKGMAMIGASIGITFSVSLVAAPVLFSYLKLSGLFGLTAVLSLFAIGVVIWRLPKNVTMRHQEMRGKGVKEAFKVLLAPDLLRLDLGIFSLHLTQMALFVVLPGILVRDLNLPVAEHWKIYLPVVFISFIMMIPAMVWSEKKAKTKVVKLAAIGLMALVLIGLIEFSGSGYMVIGLLLVYFVGFNLLEATLPSWVSRVAPLSHRGLALGVYNTSQSLGLFAGGALGGWALKHLGAHGVFEGVLAMIALWFLVAAGIKALPPRGQAPSSAQAGS